MGKFLAGKYFQLNKVKIFLELNHIAKNYLFYLVASFLRLAIFYYIAVFYGKQAFISYNLYLAYSEIAMMAACVGTATIFIVKDNIAYKLSSAILFENMGVVLSFLVIWVLMKFKLLGGGDDLSMPLLALLILGRTNNQIFTRYYNLIKSNMALSTLIDIVGSYSWVAVVLAISIFHRIEHLDVFIYFWIMALAVTNALNFYYARQEINLKESAKNLWYFFITSIKSANFSLVGVLFSNVEKIIVVHKFIGLSITIVSSYLALSKVLGFLSDLTTGFMSKLLGSRLSRLDQSGIKANMYLWGTLFVNTLLFVVGALGVYLLRDLIHYLIKNQVDMEYISLLLYLIPVCIFNNIRSLTTFYFQRHKNFYYLNVTAFFQLALLALLFILPITIFQFVLFEAAYLAILFIMDVFYLWYLYHYSEPLAQNML